MPTNKQIIQGAYQAFAEGDVAKVLALMDDKIEWTEADGFPLHGTYVGPQAVVEGVFMRLGEIGDDHSHPDPVRRRRRHGGRGRYVLVETSFDGQTSTVQMAHVWTLRDGRVISMQQHVDR